MFLFMATGAYYERNIRNITASCMFLSSFRDLDKDAAEHEEVLRENKSKPSFLSAFNMSVLPHHSMFLKLNRNTNNTVLFFYSF